MAMIFNYEEKQGFLSNDICKRAMLPKTVMWPVDLMVDVSWAYA